jgi:ATP-dependent DNA helicase RecG
MKETDLSNLLSQLCTLPSETEWLEFKENNSNPSEIGEYISALANAAALHHKNRAYIVWGVNDQTHQLVGTNFKPRQEKQGNEELENWLIRLLFPKVDFCIYEFQCDGYNIVLFEIKPVFHGPVRFQETEYIRVGTYKKKLKDFPEKERELWIQSQDLSFEKGISRKNVNASEVLKLIDYPAFFELFDQNLPENQSAILEQLRKESLIVPQEGLFSITNLGAILFAKNLDEFENLARKAPRVVIYRGNNRLEALREQIGKKGYASGFKGLLRYIDDQLPSNEEIGRALRKEVKMYPPLAIRELIANVLIHQDFALTGTGPMIEIFSDRIEITNPGVPLIDTLRFIDEPPRSRNEGLASIMRRLNICEERGSGIDKVIFQVEFFQLPAPDFQVTSSHTKAILYAYKKLADMDREDRLRACYQHACLCWVSNTKMTNTTLRKRFGIGEKNYPMVSRIISDTLNERLIKRFDPENASKRHASYVPFWL